MFDDVTEILLQTLATITSLKYIPTGLDVGATGDPGSTDVWLSSPRAEVSDNLQVVVPVYRPEEDQSAAKDYRPLRRLPLVLQLHPYILVPMPGNEVYDATLVAMACVHALCFTTGPLADFMAVEHPLIPSNKSGQPPNPDAFDWSSYRLETVNVVYFGPSEGVEGTEIRLRLDGLVWLHPETAPTPTVIEEVRAPRQPPPPDPEQERGFDEIVGVVSDNGG
ncbi:hypothetical protein [Haliangium sp.]|uniref:hypothetical protein n=1 Tax=Haliangium sp. TaxID=2663208 RepID=UPI003D135462